MVDAAGQDTKKGLGAELGKDKKKTVILVVFAVIALIVVYARLIKKSPEKASAAADTAAKTTTASQSPEPEVPMLLIPMERDPVAAAYLETLSHEITEDLFQFKSEHFAPIFVALPEPVEEDLPEEEDKSLPETPAEKINWMSVITKQAKDLHLESLIASDSPIAVINATVVGIDDRINGFTIVEIHSGECIVEKRGIRVALKMPD